MTTGNQPSQGSVNQTLGSLATDLRDICARIANFQTWAVGAGLAGLEAINFTPDAAQDVLNKSNYLSTINGVYKGTVQQGGTGGTGAILFNFDNALAPLWGGQ